MEGFVDYLSSILDVANNSVEASLRGTFSNITVLVLSRVRNPKPGLRSTSQ